MNTATQRLLEPVRLKDLTSEKREKLMERAAELNESIFPSVRSIMDDVKVRGDKAVLEYEEKFDGARLSSLRVIPGEIAQARNGASPELISALENAITNIRAFHSKQLQLEPEVETQNGIKVWRVWRPIDRIGIYIPGGNAAYPSTVAMDVTPAQIAGCKKIILCTPPDEDGNLPQPILVVASLLGIEEIYKVGGVQAIAAMTFGTETIPQVDKIFGPGNQYVTAAKMLVPIISNGKISIDAPAGPSEVAIIADDEANPVYVAADLLAQSEHGDDSACILITPSLKLAEAVSREIGRQIQTLATAETMQNALTNYGGILIVDSLEEAIDFVNEYAPEHLEIITKDDSYILAKIRNAGSIFLGNWSTEPAGDYASGSNHTLPTGGAARSYCPLSVESYGRKLQVQELTKEGLNGIRNTIETLARVEGLPGHGQATRLRFEKL